MILKFTAKWCSSCILTNKAFYKLVDDYKTYQAQIEYTEIDIDSEENLQLELLLRYNVNNQTVLPIMVFLDETGLEYNRVKGEKNRTELIQIIDSHLKYHNKASPSQQFSQTKNNFISNLSNIFRK